MDSRPDLELVELRDAADTAERSVVHWQQRLQRKVAAATELGGFVSWVVDSITGGREQRIEEAIAEVERVKARLEEARRTREEARARLAAAEQDRLDRATETEVRHARREAMADRVRVADHPLARTFNDIEARLDALQLEHDTVQQAYTAGTGLAAALKSTRRSLEHMMARPPSSRRRHNRSRVPSVDDDRMQRIASQARAFEDACATMGLSMSVHIATPIRDRMGELVRNWGHSFVAGMMSAAESDAFGRSLDSAVDATEGALAPMLEQLRQLQSEIERLREQRAAILDRFGD